MKTKTKSISELVIELQKDNEELQYLNTLFEKACKKKFGYDTKTITLLLEKARIYEAKRAEKPAQRAQTIGANPAAYNQSSSAYNTVERKADQILDLDRTSAGLSAGAAPQFD